MSAYTTGTVDITGGTNVVNGLDTLFLSNVQPGQLIRIGSVKAWFEIASVVGDTVLHLASNFPTSQDDVLFQVLRDYTPNRNYPELNQGDINSADIITRTFRQIDADAQFGLVYGGQFISFESSPSITGLADGDVYIVGPTPSGVFVGHQGDIATYASAGGGTWTFTTPEDQTYFYRQEVGDIWVVLDGEMLPWAITVDVSGSNDAVYLRIDGDNSPAKRWIHKPSNSYWLYNTTPASGEPSPRMELYMFGVRQTYYAA